MSDKTSSLANLAPQKQRRSGLGRPWMPGQSGNPAGRPKGLRPRVNERFLSDMLADWEAHGPQAIERMREEDPSGYVKCMVTLVSKSVKVEHTVLDDLHQMTDEELEARVRALAREYQELLPISGDLRSKRSNDEKTS